MECSYRVKVVKPISTTNNGCIFEGKPVGSKRRPFRIVVEGGVMEVIKGELYDVEGEWEKWSPHKPRPNWMSTDQLRCGLANVKRQLPAGDLVGAFLMEKLPHLGPVRVNRFIKTYGDQLPLVLGNPHRIEEVARLINPSLSAFSIRLATAIYVVWQDYEAAYKATLWLQQQGITNRRLARLIVEMLGGDTIDALSRNPYILAPVLPWEDVEALGKQLLKDALEGPENAQERLVGAVDSVMQDIVHEGHTAIPKGDLPPLVADKLGIRKKSPLVDQAIQLGIINEAIMDGGAIWRVPGCALMEEELHRRFRALYGMPRQSLVETPKGTALLDFVRKVVKANKIRISEEQIRAVVKVLGLNLAVLTGGAGTGKTTTTRAICAVWEALGGEIVLTALAGKAALRINQATGRKDAKTIYRLLKLLELEADDPFAEIRPKLGPRTLLIIDEASMVDLGQWHQLFEAMTAGCQVVMVGDAGQLAPIGFGLVFHLLCKQDEITARLTEIHRTADESHIPFIANSVLAGKMPQFDPYQGKADGVVNFIAIDEDCADPLIAILEALDKVTEDLGDFSPKMHNLQIIAALNKGKRGGIYTGVSVASINNRYHAKFAFAKGLDEVKGHLGEWFSVDDPVIHTRNDYQEGLYNGSLGHVTVANLTARTIIIEFDEGEAKMTKEFDAARMIDLERAYALTCHKAQGSQAERIIIPLVPTMLNDPTWLYTAITRSTKQCVIIGKLSVLKQALAALPRHMARCVGTDFRVTFA